MHTHWRKLWLFGANDNCPRQMSGSVRSAALLYRFMNISQKRISWTSMLANVSFSCVWFCNRKEPRRHFFIFAKHKQIMKKHSVSRTGPFANVSYLSSLFSRQKSEPWRNIRNLNISKTFRKEHMGLRAEMYTAWATTKSSKQID